jgi:hypothetical protein
MARNPYLAIRNWQRFQHYKDGRPLTWIKLYVALLDDRELRALPPETRLLWDQLLLLAGRTDNRIPSDPRWISECTGIDIVSVQRGTHLLVKGRWLRRFDSRRALDLARAREEHSRAEKRREETPLPPLRDKPKTTGWREVRGTHGITHIPDPFGTDRPPQQKART